MIRAKHRELKYDLFNENDYETYFIDECITLVRILSEEAWNSIYRHTKNQPLISWEKQSSKDDDHAIFMATSYGGQVTILNFKDKIYTQSGKFISLYEWLKNYYQLLQELMPIGEKYNVLALTLHSERPIAEECYEDILEEEDLLYESVGLSCCPNARKAIIALDAMLVRYLLETITPEERALALTYEPMVITFYPDATPEERLSAIQQNPFIICDIEAVNFNELSLAFNSINENGERLTALPFKKVTKDGQLLAIRNKESFIRSISNENMPDSIYYDFDSNLVFCFSQTKIYF